jgi:hypothetical protein
VKSGPTNFRDALDGGPKFGQETSVPKAGRMRVGMAVALFAALLIGILRTTLPGPLSAFSPDLALSFNANHPVALIAKAELLRERFVELSAQAREQTRLQADAEQPTDESQTLAQPQANSAQPKASGDRFAFPDLLAKGAGKANERADELDSVRTEIATLARKAIESAPMNARAYRLLAEVTSDPQEVRKLMSKAAQLSPRETLALAWLVAEAAQRGDLATMVDNSDKIMRTRPALVPTMAQQLAVAIDSEEGRKLLVDRMAEHPAWRETFLRTATQHVKQLPNMLALFGDIASSSTPPTVSEARSLVSDLLVREQPGLAHDAWTMLAPRGDTSRRGQLHNSAFDRNFSGYAFDWDANVVQGATIDQFGTELGRKALRVSFDGSRVRGLSVRQATILSPGSYRLSGMFKGWLAGNRGLRWQTRCLYGTREVLGQTEMLAKTDGAWEEFEFAFEVIDIDACKAQTIVLMHDARSASEEVVSGEMQFDAFNLVQAKPVTPTPTPASGTDPSQTGTVTATDPSKPAQPPPPTANVNHPAEVQASPQEK